MQRSGSRPGGEQDRRRVVDARAQLGRVVGDGRRVQVDDAVDRRVAAVLAGDVLRDRADVVAEVLAAGRLDAGEDGEGHAGQDVTAAARPAPAPAPASRAWRRLSARVDDVDRAAAAAAVEAKPAPTRISRRAVAVGVARADGVAALLLRRAPTQRRTAPPRLRELDVAAAGRRRHAVRDAGVDAAEAAREERPDDDVGQPVAVDVAGGRRPRSRRGRRCRRRGSAGPGPRRRVGLRLGAVLAVVDRDDARAPLAARGARWTPTRRCRRARRR